MKENEEQKKLLEEKCNKDPFGVTDWLFESFRKARVPEEFINEYCITFIVAPIEIRKEMIKFDNLAKYSLVSSAEKNKIFEGYRKQILRSKGKNEEYERKE